MAKKKSDPPSGDLLTSAELDALVPDILLMEAYCEAVRNRILYLLEAGEEFKNAAKVPKRPVPKWMDEEAVVQLLAKHKLLPLDTYRPRKLFPQGAFKKAFQKEIKADKVRPAVQAILDLIVSESSGYNLELRTAQKD